MTVKHQWFCKLVFVLFFQVALSAIASPRIVKLFDFDWKFYRGDITGASAPAYADKYWRTIDLPHDWSIENYSGPVKPDTFPELNIVDGQWRFQKGDEMQFAQAGYNDAAWMEVTLPQKWEDFANYTQDSVYGWFRRSVEVPDSLVGKSVAFLLGRIDDVDEVYLNGECIGSTGSFPPKFNSAWAHWRRYVIPDGKLLKNNTIALRVYDERGGGGILASNGDYDFEGPFYSLAEGEKSTGFTVGGTGWYRKNFTLPETFTGKQVFITVEGVYMNSDCWINGHHLGNHPYGYTEFSYDLTPYLNPIGQTNILAVEVKNHGQNSRWYSGSGIYRHVWLVAVEPVHIQKDGVRITTNSMDEDQAFISADISVVNTGKTKGSFFVKCEVISPAGEWITAISTTVKIKMEEEIRCFLGTSLSNPQLWDLDSPNLYTLQTSIYYKDELIDRVENTFGIRDIRFDAERGFLLNEKPVQLKGGCMHHDNGPLGSAAYDRAEERRVQLMKANGFNAIRTSHNPPSRAFLDACDRLGMLVIVEAFDDWIKGKKYADYHLYFYNWWQKDIESMVLRDRNHPSIIMWSTGNEIMDKQDPEAVKASAFLADEIRKLDSSSPVTCGVNKWQHEDWDQVKAHFMSPLDVVGYNYLPERYADDFVQYPQRIMYGSESYPRNAFEYWMPVLDYPFVIGDFVWTGFDYLGEAAIGWYGFTQGYPWTVAYCGDIDLCGFKRPQSYYREVVWGTGSKVAMFVHNPEPTFERENTSAWSYDDVHPSWTWPGHMNDSILVDIYSSCDSVRLFLNDKHLTTRQFSRDNKFKAGVWVTYQPGLLKAEAYEQGYLIETDALETTGRTYALRMTADKDVLHANGHDLSYVTVELIDDQGRRCPFAEQKVYFEIEGPGELIGVGNGKPNSTEAFQANCRTTFEGRALAIIKSGKQTGEVKLRAFVDGLEAEEVVLRVLQ